MAMATVEKISILLPTRQRPHFVKRLWDSILETADSPQDLEIVLAVDSDDQATIDFLTPLAEQDKRVKFIVDPRDTNLSRLWNKCYKLATGTIFHHCGDDNIFRSKHWDTLVRNQFSKYPDRIVFVYGRDGVVDARRPPIHKPDGTLIYRSDFGTHGFLHKNWIDVTGYFCPPYFSSDYNDTWFNDVAKQLNRHVFLQDIYIEHMHFSIQKSPEDQNTKDRLERHQKDQVEKLYAEKQSERFRDAVKLRAFMDNFSSRRKIGFIGIGKLGLPVCVAYGMKGHDVLGFDVNPKCKPGIAAHTLIATEEEGYSTGVSSTYSQESFLSLCTDHGPRFAESVDEVIAHSDLVFVAVQTPHKAQFEGHVQMTNEREDFDYSFLVSSLKTINESVKKLGRETAVVVISTVLPGTFRRELLPIVADNPLLKLVYNPYFIAMGTVLKDMFEPEFTLIGVQDEKDQATIKKLTSFYSTLSPKECRIMNIENAECVKVFYNTFITTKICFANAMLEMCHHLPGTDVDVISNTLGLAKQRIASGAYMRAGLGDGGACHPRDNIALSWLSTQLKLRHNFFDQLMRTREYQAQFQMQLLLEQHKKHPELPICILGKAFKPNTNIVTGSPTLLMLDFLRQQESEVKVEVIDPIVDKVQGEEFKLGKEPKLYVMGCQHLIFKTCTFPSQSVIIDTFRYLPAENRQGCVYVPVGKGG